MKTLLFYLFNIIHIIWHVAIFFIAGETLSHGIEEHSTFFVIIGILLVLLAIRFIFRKHLKKKKEEIEPVVNKDEDKVYQENDLLYRFEDEIEGDDK